MRKQLMVGAMMVALAMVVSAAAPLEKPRVEPGLDPGQSAVDPGAVTGKARGSIVPFEFAVTGKTINVPFLGGDTTDWPSVHGYQTGRLGRFGVISTCAAPKACPGLWDSSTRVYDAFTFTNASSATACVSVDLTQNCGVNLFMVAYVGAYDPANLCTNYAADYGSSDTLQSISFDVPAHTPFTLVFHEVSPGGGCPSPYTFTVSGISLTDTTFLDDLGRSQACVNRATGYFIWNILSGPNAGYSVTGTAQARNGGTLFYASTPAYYFYCSYDPIRKRATGYFYDYTSHIYSSLSDANTANNPPGCDAVPPPV